MIGYCATTSRATSTRLIVLLACIARIASLSLHFGAVHFDATDIRLQLIHEGTKWCGMGDIADGDNDLGEYRSLDACCREHDKCFDFIPAGEEKHGLRNDHSFVMSHCSCDLVLYNCLKSVNGTKEENNAVDSVGDEYFNDFNVQCFDLTQPAECVQEETRQERLIIPLKRTKCTQYQYLEGEEEWQWFDVPFY